MNDLISSQDATQAINLLKDLEQRLDDYYGLNDKGKAAFRMAITALELFGNAEQLPPAQPEIIRCKNCKNSEHWYRDRRRCFLWSEDGISVFDDGFCNYAERRHDD